METSCKSALTPSAIVTEAMSAVDDFPFGLLDQVKDSKNYGQLLVEDWVSQCF